MKTLPELGPSEPARVVAGGIDSLVLAIDLRWPDDQVFVRLAEMKETARKAENDEPTTIVIGGGSEPARFVVKPHGKNGFEWLLVGQEMGISLANWREPKSRPSAMVDIRSEALWTHGAEAAVERVLGILTAMSATVVAVKPSRLDLCVDILLCDSDWRSDLDQHFVTRARGTSQHRSHGDLSGFSIGKGAVSARLYDKPREIREKSHKDWMYAIWGLPCIPKGHRIIRVEFQLRRDVLRDTKAHTWTDAMALLARMWAYCSCRWLRLAVDARAHHTQQNLLPWWAIVQSGFPGAQGAEPLVREKAINTDKRRLAAQSLGTLVSIAALGLGDADTTEAAVMDRSSFLRSALADAERHAWVSDEEFTRRINRKRAKYGRKSAGFGAGEVTRAGPEVGSASNPDEKPA